MSDDHPIEGGLCLWDTCSGCGYDSRFERGFDPSHLCVDCDEALAVLRDLEPRPDATVTQLHPPGARRFHPARRAKRL